MSSFLQRLPNPPTTNFALPSSFTCSLTFLPTQIPGLQLWLDGTDPNATGVAPANGSTLSTWKDKSGNGRDATAVGTPSYSANILNAIGAPLLTGSTSYFTTPSFITSPTGIPSIFIVMRQTSIITGNSDFFLATDYRVIDLLGHNYNVVLVLAGTTETTLTANSVTLNPTLISVIVTAGVGGVSYINGTYVATSGSSGGGLASSYVYKIGGGPGFVGYLYEVIIYDSPLTTSQRQQVEGYLSWKWGLQANLPASHQYKAITPSPLFSTQAFVSTTMAQRLPSLVRYVSFTPSSFSGLQLWLDAADPSVVIKSGTTVTAWNDKSGNGYNMNTLPDNYYTGNPPIYPSVGTAINKLSTIYFSAFAGLKQATVINGAKNFYWVGRIASDTGGDGVYFLMGSDNTSGFYDWHGSGGVNTLILTTVYAQAGILAASPASQYTSGANAVVNTTFSNIIYPSAGDISLLSVAGLSGNTRYQGVCFDRIYHPGWCGDLAEVVIYSTALTTFQHQKVEGYLAWKWGLQGTLPAKHPYKLFPPAP
jgi:hypothetical protein